MHFAGLPSFYSHCAATDQTLRQALMWPRPPPPPSPPPKRPAGHASPGQLQPPTWHTRLTPSSLEGSHTRRAAAAAGAPAAPSWPLGARVSHTYVSPWSVT
jgi:hypothetical protein